MLVEVCGGVVCDKMGLGVCGMNGGGGGGVHMQACELEERAERERGLF